MQETETYPKIMIIYFFVGPQKKFKNMMDYVLQGYFKLENSLQGIIPGTRVRKSSPQLCCRLDKENTIIRNIPASTYVGEIALL